MTVEFAFTTIHVTKDCDTNDVASIGAEVYGKLNLTKPDGSTTNIWDVAACSASTTKEGENISITGSAQTVSLSPGQTITATGDLFEDDGACGDQILRDHFSALSHQFTFDEVFALAPNSPKQVSESLTDSNAEDSCQVEVTMTVTRK